jgi:hypothetical protein
MIQIPDNIKLIIKTKFDDAVKWGRAFDFADLTYFPFIGWIYPFVSRSGEAFAYSHAKQAFALAVIFTATGLFFTSLEFLTPYALRGVKFGFIVLIYLSHLIYFVMCARGTYFMRKKAEAKIPAAQKYIDSLNL